MIKRMENENDSQFIDRLQTMVKKALIKIDTQTKQLKDLETVNLRTGRKYKDDAESMFMGVATIESILREKGTESDDLVLIMVRGLLEDQGFDIKAIYENLALKDGAYFGIKNEER